MCWPPSGVRVISWSRNCPNCMAMWDNFSEIFVSLSHLPQLSHLCILVDTSRGLTFTYKIPDIALLFSCLLLPCVACALTNHLRHMLLRSFVSVWWQKLPSWLLSRLSGCCISHPADDPSRICCSRPSPLCTPWEPPPPAGIDHYFFVHIWYLPYQILLFHMFRSEVVWTLNSRLKP